MKLSDREWCDDDGDLKLRLLLLLPLSLLSGEREKNDVFSDKRMQLLRRRSRIQAVLEANP